MASKIKRHVSQRILESLQFKGSQITLANDHFPKHLVVGNKNGEKVELHLPVKEFVYTLQKVFNVDKTTIISNLKDVPPDGTISGTREITDKHKGRIAFIVDRDLFVQEVIDDTVNSYNPYNRLPYIASYPLGKTVVVEYSSPNIAKPFHVGHLRSTIVGNFIAKIHEFLSHNVVKINYLGDWGTQFGLIKVGLDMGNYSSALEKNPIQTLYEAYVHANKAAESNPNISVLARKTFEQLELGNIKELSDWQNYRNFTVTELENVYKRLGVTFSEYAWESMYKASNIQTVLSNMKEKNILKTSADGKQVIEIDEGHHVPIIKSDGTTLYLARDIAAALDRFEKHNFDEMLYVVDSAQRDHFISLFKALQKMDLPWAKRLRHIQFGRIHGMSTRKGNVTFLSDILDEVKQIMEMKQLQSPTTKVNLKKCPETADILGISAVIVNDLKQRRQRNYTFDWDKATQVRGDTGIRLQYAHCRLWNLEKNCGARLANQCDPKALSEQEATVLVQEIARFDEVLRLSYEELEACILVNYLFHLCNAINQAFKALPVKGQDKHTASQRLMMFHAARLVLNQGMRILGLQPLQEM